MRRWETLTALTSVVLASVGSIRQLPFHHVFTAIAVGLILLVGGSRLYHARRRPIEPPAFDPAERARTIRARRERKP